jgi:hypothetical protein
MTPGGVRPRGMVSPWANFPARCEVEEYDPGAVIDTGGERPAAGTSTTHDSVLSAKAFRRDADIIGICLLTFLDSLLLVLLFAPRPASITSTQESA